MAWTPCWDLFADIPLPGPATDRHSVLLYAGIAAAVVLLLLLWLVVVRRKPKAYDPEAGMSEDLATYPLAPPLQVSRCLTFQGHPVRVRLVVAAPVGRKALTDDGDIEPILDKIVSGLGAATRQDRARIRQWPLGLSVPGFAPMFFRRVIRHDAAGSPSHWILLAGQARGGPRTLLLGLALWSDEPTEIGNVAVQGDEWNELLRVEAVT